MSLYGLICLILCGLFLFSVCRTWKTALILAAVFLALIGSSVLVIQIQKQLERREQQKEIEMQRAYEEKMFQVFNARTPEEIAFDHLSYYRGMSKTNLINRLETRDGMSFDMAQNLDVDYAQDVIVRSKYFSGMIYSDVNREDYERYYEKWL